MMNKTLIFPDDIEKSLLSFHNEGSMIGELRINEQGKLDFTGNMEESAEKLFHFLKNIWDTEYARKVNMTQKEDKEQTLLIKEELKEYADALIEARRERENITPLPEVISEELKACCNRNCKCRGNLK